MQKPQNENVNKNKSNFAEKLKNAWSNKSVKAIIVAFAIMIVFTVLKITLKF